MQISITGRHVTVTDNVKAHINDKLERSLGVFPRIESIHVILDEEKILKVAEVVIQAANHIRVSATENLKIYTMPSTVRLSTRSGKCASSATRSRNITNRLAGIYSGGEMWQ